MSKPTTLFGSYRSTFGKRPYQIRRKGLSTSANLCWQIGPAKNPAAPLQQDDIVPNTFTMSWFFTIANFAEATFPMQRTAGGVVSKNFGG